MTSSQEENKGLIIVYTGNGKGKTTAALGMCIRAAGYKKKIKILQFVKGSWKYGELKGIELLKDFVDMEQVGEGFVGIVDDNKEFSVHLEAARKGLAYAREIIHSGQYDIVILDELNIAIDLGLIPLADALEVIQNKPAQLHLVSPDVAPNRSLSKSPIWLPRCAKSNIHSKKESWHNEPSTGRGTFYPDCVVYIDGEILCDLFRTAIEEL